MREKVKLKYEKKEGKGLRKLVKNMTPREHRAVLKKWKEHCTVCRAKRLRLKTPVPVQISPAPNPVVSSASLQQRKKKPQRDVRSLIGK